MRNKPFNPFVETESAARGDIGAQPVRRLLLIALCLCIPIPVIAARVAFVQTVMSTRFVSLWEQTTETREYVPARDGRIVSQDGVVLAYDDPVFSLAVQYRWLESPPDETWLRRSALSTLTRTERRDRNLVELARQKVLARRDQLWNNLAETTGFSREALESRALTIQQRIERMKAAANRKREERQAAREIQPLKLTQGWQGIWKTLRDELTTPPDRYANDPLILKEELQAHPLIDNISIQIVGTVESYPSQFPGVEVLQTAHRVYPQGRLGAHVLGVRKGIQGDPAGPESVQTIGELGIEQQYNQLIQARPGIRTTTRDRRGNIVEVTIDPAPQDGHETLLTIDSRLQQSAEELLDRVLRGEQLNGVEEISFDSVANPVPVGGVILVMDVWTGDLLVAASGPAPAQSRLQHPTQEDWKSLNDDPRAPLFPRITKMALPPGGIFNALVAAAGLESRQVTIDDQIFCRGYLDSPESHRCAIYRQIGAGHGEMNLTRALSESCNVYFFEVARMLGPEPMTALASQMGLGTATGVDLPGEVAGFLPSPGKLNNGVRWTPGSTLQLAIGQGATQVTPLQICRVLAAIANGGYLVTPQILNDEKTAEANQLPPDMLSAPPVKKVEGLSSATLAVVRDGLLKAVESERGTARNARVEGISVAGKTGTAEVGNQKPPHAWFSGFFPADHPRYVCTVVLEHGGVADRSAAPIAREVIQSMAILGFITPDFGAVSKY